MGIEIATLAILPLIAASHHPRAVEATTKYFLLQAIAATLILFSAVTSITLSGESSIFLISHQIPLTLVSLALALKIGLAPLHL